MITETITINGSTYTIDGNDQPNPLSPDPRITATLNGITADLNCQYRQITSAEHTNGCTWGVRMNPTCTCAPVPTADRDALFAAARTVLSRCWAAWDAAEAANREARASRTAASDAFVRVPRGCDGCPSAIYGGPCTCC